MHDKFLKSLSCYLHVAQVQNPRLVTSYAFPPTASLTSTPYSVYRKGSSKSPSHRFTYASLTGSASTDKPQLVCFHETISGDHSETTKTSYTHSEHPSQLVSLDALPVAGGGSNKAETHDIVTTFDNGDVICLSADLQIIRWVANLNLMVSSGHDRMEIEHVTMANAKAVTRGLLRNRGDVAAILNGPANEDDDLLELTQIFCVIGTKPNGIRKLSLLQVQSRSADLTTTYLSPLKHLLSWDLPQPSKVIASSTSVPQFILHSSSGSLHILIESTLLSYDLASTIPKLNSELQLSEPKVESFLRTSQDVIFTISKGMCRMFDVKFNSLRACVALSSIPSALDLETPSKKRKNAQAIIDKQSSQHHDLITYFSDAGLIVAVRENELLGMQLGPARSRKRVKTEGTLLIDALGKGVDSKLTIVHNSDLYIWQKKQTELNNYATQGKIAKFEAHFAADLGIELESANPEIKKENEINGGPLTNSVGPKIPDEDVVAVDMEAEEPSEDELRSWILPTTTPINNQRQYHCYALYALSKIFCWSDPDTDPNASLSKEHRRGCLKIQFFPPNVFQWLLQTGHLTKECIRRSLLQETPKDNASMFMIADGDIVDALVEFDPELHILSAVLNYNHFLPVGEVVQAIQVLIENINDESEEKVEPRLLTNGTIPSEDEMDIDITSELDAASDEIDRALSVLNHGLVVRSHALRPALIRLHTFPGPVISSTLRVKLSRQNLESLIRLLHLELKNGGWTASYDFSNSEHVAGGASTDDPDDHAVTIIASLLSSTLDAIGVGAWVASVGNGSSATEGSEEMIASLHKDTSEALNGFWEARYMRGLLSEFLRYASALPPPPRQSKEKLQGHSKPFLVTGTLEEDADLPMLPLGSKPDLRIEKTKKGSGGRKDERSKREMGMLISQRVPKYSFERIVI